MLADMPAKIGKYDVIAVLGKGGMGIVYKARDPFLDRLVAIKMMTGLTETPDQLQRFYQEAKFTAGLSHPNIITVFDRGEHEGNPYLVMQFLEGSSLESLIRSKLPMTLFDKINTVVEVCHGLAYAHQRGVVHRDIKPANIMVLKDNSVKIVDFGIARIGDKARTQTGLLMGSLPYMSPEQLSDKFQVDSRTDIYSTGVVLFELLTGHLPFDGETAASTFGKILFEPPPALGKFIPSCPPELETIVPKSLSKNRDERYSTADELALDLAQLQDRLKREAIDVHLQKAEFLLGKKSLQQANDELIEALKLDKQDMRAMTLLRSVRNAIQQEQNAERIRVLKEQAEGAYRKEEFESALSAVDQAIVLDSEDVELQQLRATVQNARAKSEQVRQALARAESAYRAGNMEAAKRNAEEALALRPNDTQANALHRAIQTAIEERIKQERLDELLESARLEMSQRRYTAALLILKEAETVDPEAPRLQQMIDQFNAGRQQERQRRELEQITQNIEQALRTDDNQAALDLVAEGLRKFPGDAGLTRLEIQARTQNEAAQQKMFVRNQIARTRELLNSGDAAGALAVLQQSLQKAPGNSHFESLLATVRDRLAEDETVRSRASLTQKPNPSLAGQDNTGATQILGAARLPIANSPRTDNAFRDGRGQQEKSAQPQTYEETAQPAQDVVRDREYGEVPTKAGANKNPSAFAKWLGEVKKDWVAKTSAVGTFAETKEKWPGSRLAVIAGLVVASAAMIFLVFHKAHKPPPPPPPPKMQVHILTNPPGSTVFVNSQPVDGDVLELPAGSNNDIQISKPGYKTKEMTQQPQPEWSISLAPEPLHLRIITSERKGTVELDDQRLADFADGTVEDLEIPPDDKDHKLSVVVQHKPVFTVRFHAAPGSRPRISSIDSKDIVAVSSLGPTATAYSRTELKHVQVGDQTIADITAAGLDLPSISEGMNDLTFHEGTEEKHIALENKNAPTLLLQTIAANEGTFLIKSDPQDAKLTIDSKEIKRKKSGWQIVRVPGSYNFTVSADGYEPQSLTILLGQGQTLPKTFTLARKGPTTGALVVMGGTPGSEVLLDGKKLGDLDGGGSGRFPNIAFGRYSLTLQKPGYISRTHEATLDPKIPEYSVRELRLSAMGGKLVFSSSQKNATVKYRRVGEDKFVTVTGPAATEEVSPGQYEVLAQAPGLQDFRKVVTVEPGQDRAVVVKFPPPSTVFEDSSQVSANGEWYRAINPKLPVYLKPGVLNVNLVFNKAKSFGFIPKKVHWQIESADGKEKVVYELGDGGLSRTSVKEGVESDKVHGKSGVSANSLKTFSVHIKVVGNHITITNDAGEAMDDYVTAGFDFSNGRLGIRTDSLFLVRAGN